MLTKPITLAGTATPTAGGGTAGSSSANPGDQLAPYSDKSISSIISQRFDIPSQYVNLILDPSSMNDANKAAAAKAYGNTPEEARKNAENPIYLRQPGDRLPTEYELQNPVFYDANREPVIGPGGETLNSNAATIDEAIKFEQNGYIPPKGSSAYKLLADFNSSVGETYEQTIQRMNAQGDSLNLFGQPAQDYPANLQKLQNKDAIPNSGIYYNPPAYKTVQNSDGTTTTQYLNVGWDGKAAGWNIQPENATSNENLLTPGSKTNPANWVLPNGNTVQSIPGSGPTVGVNLETGKYQIRPWEVGQNTTWEMAAYNPETGKLDLSTITKEVAQQLSQYGNLPAEYAGLVDTAPSYYSKPSSTPINTDKSTTPPPAKDNNLGMPAVRQVTVKTGGGYSGTGAMYAQPKPGPSGMAPADRTIGNVPVGTKVSPGQDQTAPQVAPRTSPVGGLPGGASGAVKPVAPNPISLPRMTAL